jgi:membrane-bound lytic murein transglycosylase D
MHKFLAILLIFSLLICESCIFRKSDPKPHRSKYKSKGSNLWYVKNARVNQYKHKYSRTQGPELMWRKAQPYLPYIKSVFRKYDLPNELCLLPMIESSFNPKAANTRAAGMWQFVEPTAKEYGLRINFFSDQRYDWKKSTVAAAKYLSWLADRYDRDWALVLAAYNMGPGAISRSIEKQGTSNYWNLRIREETMNYVPKFIGLLQVIRERRK